jgi:hypothetical protein
MSTTERHYIAQDNALANHHDRIKSMRASPPSSRRHYQETPRWQDRELHHPNGRRQQTLWHADSRCSYRPGSMAYRPGPAAATSNSPPMSATLLWNAGAAISTLCNK